ncbi:TadE/TadG family type IV pilus assembly protein [Oceanicella actignis]|uniref:TadE/TadG family type IV pilus assembly protein n=1 Tax=Oceanicella actignis TaxID=1189325 RepID=UPI0011E7A3A1|nr:hypothetical protein [Oceanicella actignis]TYO91319.1 hypothetical protein LY05_00170 [Oceanicella actignis]
MMGARGETLRAAIGAAAARPARLLRRCAARARRMRGDERGAITVEFVIWVPILIFWLVASLAFYDAFRDRGNAVRASNVIADIVSRQTEVNDAFVSTLHDLLQQLLSGSPPGKWLRISSVKYEGGRHFVEWSAPSGSGLPLTDADLDPAQFPRMADGDSLILVETFVPFEPILSWTGIEATTLHLRMPTEPRFTSKIAYRN